MVRRLESKFIINLHTTLLSWIVGKVAGHHAVGDTRMRTKSLVLFRSLSPLLTHVEARDALQMQVPSVTYEFTLNSLQ